MKIILTFLLNFTLLVTTLAQTKHVVTHQNVFINTDPSKGVKSFKNWGEFPEESSPIRKITLHLTLAHPEDNAIAHWDYMDRVKILRKGGIEGESINFEIGRMLTPYGSNFKEGWNYTWKIDVTDFQAFLRDSVEIEYIHSGYESPDLGWNLTLDFEFQYGMPIANFIRVDKMWDGNFEYGNPDKSIEENLNPIKIKRAKGSAFGRFRIQQTGHGMDRPNGCSEFCSRWRELKFDEQIVDHRDIWKECGDNPLYPQGGTWIFDRGNWCPGDFQKPDIIDIPITKKSHVMDLEMEPFTANDTNQPKEQITSYFFQFAEPNNANDVAIEEIIAPNKKANFNRFNPRGFNPIIKIRNLGKEHLRNLEIAYKTIGFQEKIYKWEGDLKFYEAALILLPDEIDAKEGTNTFSVIINKPNGVEDEWDGDNNLISEFVDIPTIPSRFVVDFMTNKQPKDNTLFIVNSANDTVFIKKPNNLLADTTYLDTVDLAEGNYFLQLTDTAGNGLEFWFMADAGYGRLRLKDTQGNLIELFESDNGNGIFYGFRASKKAEVDTTIAHLSVNIYPRMVKDYATIYTTTNTASTLKIRITKDGKYIETHEFTRIKDAQTGLDLQHLEEGRYVMEIYINGEHKMNRRFNKVPKTGFKF